ncbi:hypothetical protein, partial [Actinotalea sp. JY-7885]
MSQKAEHDAVRAAFGANQWLVDELYEQYLTDKDAVDPAWWDFFEDYRPRGDQPAPDGQRPAASDGADGAATRREAPEASSGRNGAAP